MARHGNAPNPIVAGNVPSAATPSYCSQELVAWFSQFTPFVYGTTGDLRLQSNFDRLSVQRNWGLNLKKKRWIECVKIAFGTLYANETDTGKLEKWQELCREVHIKKIPCSITQCKKALGSPNVRVNLVNLINHRLNGEPVIRFKTHGEFLTYTNNGRMFPREEAKEFGFIKVLLRTL